MTGHGSDSFLEDLNSFIDEKLGPPYYEIEQLHEQLMASNPTDRYAIYDQMVEKAIAPRMAYRYSNPFNEFVSEYSARRNEKEVKRLHAKAIKHNKDLENLIDSARGALPTRTASFKLHVSANGSVKQILNWYKKRFAEIADAELFEGMEASIKHIDGSLYEVTYKTTESPSKDVVIRDCLSHADDDGNYPLNGQKVSGFIA